MQIEFDARGNSYPPRLIEMSYVDFEQHFVQNMQESETRQRLCTNFHDFIHNF